jgi:hypothetical protein
MFLNKKNYHQRGVSIMEKKTTGMTALAGLPVYLDLAQAIGLSKSIQKHLKIRQGDQGWTDSQIVIALLLLNLAGGDCVDDIKILEGDHGFCEVLRKSEMHGLRRKVRRALERRWRKEKKRTVPSPSVLFRYLAAFHDKQQEKNRRAGKAFIPSPNTNLRGLVKVNKDLLGFVQAQDPQSTATLDMDATLVETNKSDALYCYQGFKSYQPLNTWWSEHGIIVHTEFRDGNVPAGFEQLRVFKEAMACLPEGVEKVRLRSDTAGAICCDVTESLKKAVAEVADSDWQPIYKMVHNKLEKTATEWAEVCFVPNAIGHSKKGPSYRYLAKREAMAEQLELPGMERQLELPFPTMQIRGQKYKMFGIVTNMDWDGQALIDWQHKRCGKSEEAHAVMKDDLAGGKLPSGDFGENAAWWWIMIMALNLNAIMKRRVLGKSWIPKRMKAIRFKLINLPGRVLERSRSLIIRLTKGHPSFALLVEARRKIAMLMPAPVG